MKWSATVTLITLLSNFQTPIARASGPSPYYDQIFADGRLDISIFLSFEPKKPDAIETGTTPVLKQILSTVAFVVHNIGEISPIRDTENTMADVSDIEQGILGCRGCGFTKVVEEPGFRSYSTQTTYREKPIDVSVKFIYADGAVGFEKTKQEFTEALGHDDVVIYLGHSDLGHGLADFGSPMTDAGLVFVNDPIRGWMNFDKGYFSRDKYQILFLNSCKSWKYFQKPLRTRVWEKNPAKLGLVLTKDTIWFEDFLATTSVFLEGILGLQSSDELTTGLYEAANYYRNLHSVDAEKKNPFVADGLFEQTYAKKALRKRRAAAEPWHGIPF